MNYFWRYGPLCSYKGPRPIPEQVHRLVEPFPELATAAYVERYAGPVPYDAEGAFAIPDWRLLASTYDAALWRVLEMIERTRAKIRFCNFRPGRIDAQGVHQLEYTERAWQKIAAWQPHLGIRVTHAQFGLRYCNQSVQRVRSKVVVGRGGEFCLSAYDVGIMLLTHPERLADKAHMHMFCGGDEVSDLVYDFKLGEVVLFCHSADRLMCGTYSSRAYSPCFGVPTGFVPARV